MGGDVMREMKDSGIEWIGEIPAKWTRKKLSYLSERIGDGLHGTPVFDSDGCYYFINGNNIGKKEIQIKNNTDTVNFDEYRKYMQPLNNNTILISLNGTIGCVSNYNNEKIILGKSAGYIALFSLINREFIRYYLQSDASQIAFVLSFSGTTINNLSLATLRNLSVLLPDNDEQNRIVSFLDNKCAEIDNLVSDFQSQIEALEEYKRSVITEAVTKGLDPDVEMRDSGIAWVGDIPAHWITHPLYFYFGERKNKNALGLETNLLSLSYGKIIRKDINSNGGLLPESFNTYNIIEKDDIIIRPTDLQNDKRSLRTGIAREHGIITSAYIAMKAIKSVNPEYFHYLFHAYDVMKVFYNMGNGVRQGLNFSEFSRLMVFEPTIEEQNAIVAYLKEKCDEIDLAIAEKKQQIETIEEYKKSLIFEYVTGKKEVK